LLWPALWNHLHIEDSCGFQWRDVDAATLEFPQDLHNTRSRVLSPPNSSTINLLVSQQQWLHITSNSTPQMIHEFYTRLPSGYDDDDDGDYDYDHDYDGY